MLNKNLKFFLSVSLFSICCFAHGGGRTGEDTINELVGMSDLVVKTYKVAGMQGLQKISEDCYSQMGNVFACSYIDIGANYIDAGMTKELNKQFNSNITPYVYFTSPMVTTRINHVYEENGISLENRKQYVKDVTYAIQKIINNKLAEQD